MKANTRAKTGARSEEGQILILSGVIMVLAFLLAAFSVSELQGQQTRLAQGSITDLPRLYRDIREQFATTLVNFVGPISDDDNTTSGIQADITKVKYAFDTLKAEFQSRGRAHGLTVLLSIANTTDGYNIFNESQFAYNTGVVDNDRHYCNPADLADSHQRWAFANLYSYNGSYNYTGYAWNLDNATGGAYDPANCAGTANDGFLVLYQGDAHGFRGVVVNLRVLDDSGASVEEFLVIHMGPATPIVGELIRDGPHGGCPVRGQACT